MKKMICTVASVVALTACAPAWAENWHSYALDPVDNAIEFIDMDYTSPSSIWVASVSFMPAGTLNTSNNQHPVSYKRVGIDCKNREITVFEVINYRENGSVSSQLSINRTISIPPSTMIHQMWVIVCDRKSLPNNAIFKPSEKGPHEIRREFREANK